VTATISSIPTEYNGIQYRSRLEADTARLLTMLRIPFEYEAKSYLLPSGIHYRPDFLLHNRTQVLEVRGYETDHGNRQVRDFAAFAAQHGIGRYETFFGVLSPTPLVESVAAGTYDNELHGAAFRPTWVFGCIGDPATATWAMAQGELSPFPHWAVDASRRPAGDAWCEVAPAVVDGVLCVEHWSNTAPHDCEMRPVRAITEPSDLLAY
jgi:hypothetical protein